MSESLFVKLGEGRRVRNPHTGKLLLSDRVYKVSKAQFWLRRLDAGDLVACEQPGESAGEKPKASPKKKEKAGD